MHSYEFEMEEWENKKYVWPTRIYTESKSNKHFVDQDWFEPWASIYFSFNNSLNNLIPFNNSQRMWSIQLQFCEYFPKK